MSNNPESNHRLIQACILVILARPAAWRARLKTMFLRTIHLIILLATLPVCHELKAQTARKIEVRSADALEFDDKLSGAQRLIGNVVFEHEGTLLYCDSAYLYDRSNRLEAYSNVRIVGDSVTVTGDRLNYDGETRLADISGKVVRMTDPSTVLTTDRLRYDMQRKVASYTTGGKIESAKNKNELTSRNGQYFSKEKTFYFRYNVQLKNPDYIMKGDTLKYNTASEIAYFPGPTTITSDENIIYCENGYYDTKSDISQFEKNARIESKGQVISADRLWYDRNNGLGKARRNVQIVDTTEKIVLTGHYADYYEKTERILVTDSAMMQQAFAKNDTLYLHGDTLRSVTDTLVDKRLIRAYRKVKFFKNDFQGMCDSLTYSESDSLMRMFGNPVIWNEENQLTADSIRIQLANDELHILYMRTAAFIASEEDSLHFNQISGRHITGYFTDGELRKIDVRGNGQSIYYAADEDDGYIGVNKADCTDMLIHIDSSKVRRITFITKPDATLYPVNELSGKELRLRGFKWLNAHRPIKKEEIFIWREDIPVPSNKRKRL